MAYLALYRRYRPDTFDKLIGQDHIVKTLVNQIETGRLGHAYLFTGTRGTGKTSAAKIFAKAINCLHPINGSPCGECECCKALSDSSNIDVVEIDAASNNGVNEIRDLREKVQYPPVTCKYKVYIIDEVHMLTGAAFNALLKTLEEPPKHAVFILATTEVHKIPATILSRCMRFDFRLIPTEKIAELIAKIYDEQGKEYEKEAITAIAAAGEGSIRDALSIADTCISYKKGKLLYDDVTEVIGSTNFNLLYGLASSLIGGNTSDIFTVINDLSELGKSMGVLTKDLILLFRNLLVIKTCSTANKILNLPDDKFNKLKILSEGVTNDRIIRILEIFSETEAALKYTVHPRIVFEQAAVRAAKPESDYDFDALLARVSELEKKLENGVNILPVKSDNQENSVSIKKEEGKSADAKIEPEIPQRAMQQKKLSDLSDKDLEGTLLLNLRKNKHEMLWNVLQDVTIKVDKEALMLLPKNEGDVAILERADNKKYIAEALSEFGDFEIKVKISEENKMLDEIDNETEKLKKIFGDNIVIIED